MKGRMECERERVTGGGEAKNNGMSFPASPSRSGSEEWGEWDNLELAYFELGLKWTNSSFNF